MFPSAAWFFILQGKEILFLVFLIVFRNAVFYYVLSTNLCMLFMVLLLKLQDFATYFFFFVCLNLYTFHFATCSPIPLCDWYQDRGLGVSLQEHLYMCVYMYAHMYMCVYAYIYLFENSRFLPDRKCSVKQIILFWGSPAI